MIHRYNPGHGKGGEHMGMEEDPEGHWCAHEDVVALEKQAADFRASSQAHHERALRETDRCTALERELKDERAAREVTKESLMQSRAEVGGLKARVAELERLLEQERAEVEMKQAALDGSTRIWRDQKAALDQARGLLEQVEDEQRTEWYEARHRWLRAHPATAPERQSIQAMVRADLVERERLGIERYGTALYPHNGRRALQDAYEEALDLAQYLKQALVEQSTPGAAGAERVNAFILREVKDGALDNPGGVFAMLVERAEKEPGT